jgi:putative pyruvate formate lyase activating enzyme
VHRASRIALLSRTISVQEYETVLQLLADLGIENGWVQEMGAAEDYLPDFEREGHPFLLCPERTEEHIPVEDAGASIN